MLMFRVMGLFAIIPIALLLTISFFVLFAIRKAQEQGLKAFGYVIAALLWIGAVLVFSAGVYTISTGHHPGLEMMQQMMKYKMQGMMPAGQISGMMPGKMDRPMMKK